MILCSSLVDLIFLGVFFFILVSSKRPFTERLTSQFFPGEMQRENSFLKRFRKPSGKCIKKSDLNELQNCSTPRLTPRPPSLGNSAKSFTQLMHLSLVIKSSRSGSTKKKGSGTLRNERSILERLSFRSLRNHSADIIKYLFSCVRSNSSSSIFDNWPLTQRSSSS